MHGEGNTPVPHIPSTSRSQAFLPILNGFFFFKIIALDKKQKQKQKNERQCELSGNGTFITMVGTFRER